MKKLLSIILISVMLISVFAINAGAETEFTKEEATQLAFEAYKSIMIITRGEYHNTLTGESDKVKKVLFSEDELEDGVIANNGSLYEKFATREDDGVKYDNSYATIFGGLFFHYFKTSAEVKDTEFGKKYVGLFGGTVDTEFNYVFKTIEDVKSYLKEFFTDSEVEKSLYKNLFESPSNMKYELFRKSKDGSQLLIHGEGVNVWDNPPPFKIKRISGFKVNQNEAELKLCLNYSYYQTSFDINSNVTFEKTSEGWRVSGGTMLPLLRGEISPKDIVNTSDEAPLYIAAIALVSLAAPVVMKRRRREI